MIRPLEDGYLGLVFRPIVFLFLDSARSPLEIWVERDKYKPEAQASEPFLHSVVHSLALRALYLQGSERFVKSNPNLQA